MKIKKSVRYVCLGLIFAMLCGSVFFGSRSFAKYLEEYKNQQEAGVASPVVVYTRYALTRTTSSMPHTYEINNNETSFVINDVQPKDELSYYFSVKSNDNVVSNEVLLKVTVSFNVYMVALKQYEKDGVELASPVYAGFGIGMDYNDNKDLRYKGSISFFTHNGESSNYDDYAENLISSSTKDGAVSYYNDKLVYKEVEKSFISGVDGSGNDVVGKTNYCVNSIGFYMEPGVDVANGYLIRVNLPDQDFGTSSTDYIGARLHIEIDVNAVQVLSKD